MANQKIMAQMELAELAIDVDQGHAADDPFKLPAAIRTLPEDRLADLWAKDNDTHHVSGRSGRLPPV